MVSVRVVVGILAVIVIIVLFYMYPRIEGFQSGSVHVSLNDGNGDPDSNASSNTVVGGGYNIQPMDNSPMSGTAAGAGIPMKLTSYTPPLARAVLIPSGQNAGAGPRVTNSFLPVIGPTSLANEPTIPFIPSMNQQVLKTGMINIGDITTGPYASEDETSSPSFSVAASKLDAKIINTVQKNLKLGGHYNLSVTSDLSGTAYSFPLKTIDNITNLENKVYAYNFQNQDMTKEGLTFFGAKTLQFEIIQTAPLTQNSTSILHSILSKISTFKWQPVATAHIKTLPAPRQAIQQLEPTPPNAISSEPPSTMASIIPKTAKVPPVTEYTFTNKSIGISASNLADNIRSGRLKIDCNIIS
jgi:hypothetical protein